MHYLQLSQKFFFTTLLCAFLFAGCSSKDSPQTSTETPSQPFTRDASPTSGGDSGASSQGGDSGASSQTTGGNSGASSQTTGGNSGASSQTAGGTGGDSGASSQTTGEGSSGASSQGGDSGASSQTSAEGSSGASSQDNLKGHCQDDPYLQASLESINSNISSSLLTINETLQGSFEKYGKSLGGIIASLKATREKIEPIKAGYTHCHILAELDSKNKNLLNTFISIKNIETAKEILSQNTGFSINQIARSLVDSPKNFSNVTFSNNQKLKMTKLNTHEFITTHFKDFSEKLDRNMETLAKTKNTWKQLGVDYKLLDVNLLNLYQRYTTQLKDTLIKSMDDFYQKDNAEYKEKSLFEFMEGYQNHLKSQRK